MPLIGRLRNLIANPSTRTAERASLGFSLGRLLDSCGAYDDAFRAYADANCASRESAGSAAPSYDRRQHELYVDRIIAAFDRPRTMQSTTPARPVFICGMFRSGSTLIEQVLAGHPRVTAGGELGFLPSLVRTQLAPFPESMANISPSQLEAFAKSYLEVIGRLFPGAAHVTDKRPDNFLYIGLIKTLFPDARIVHTTRNPLDNCLSIFFLHLDHSMSYALDLMDTAHYYAQYRRLMSHWKALYGSDILDVDYDAFVREPQPSAQRLLDFCGLEWDEGCLSFPRARNAIRTASVWQVREPLYQRSSGRWRNYAAQIAPLEGRLREFGVEIDEHDDQGS